MYCRITVYDYERDKKEVPGGREADFGSIGRGMRCGRSGKLRGVAEPAGADARVRDAGETV